MSAVSVVAVISVVVVKQITVACVIVLVNNRVAVILVYPFAVVVKGFALKPCSCRGYNGNLGISLFNLLVESLKVSFVYFAPIFIA